MYRYQVYGFVLVSALPLPELALAASGMAPTLHISYRMAQSLPPLDGFRLLQISRYRLDDAVPAAYLYEDADSFLFRHTATADYLIAKSGQTLRVTAHVSAVPAAVRLHLLGEVLSFWMEQRGRPSLHASAVLLADGAVAFLGDAQAGKSLLAAHLVKEGAPLLTDDILAIQEEAGHFSAQPGYAQMRVWPADLPYLCDQLPPTLERVHPDYPKLRLPVTPAIWGRFCARSQRLTHIYLLERSAPAAGVAPIEITSLSPAEAAVILLQNAFVGAVVDRLGQQAQRLAFFGRLVEAVRVRRLRYPSGFQHLPAVQAAILHDLRRSHSAANSAVGSWGPTLSAN